MERIKIEDKLAEVELQHKGLQDLIVTLQDGKGAQKVAEWHGKMEQLRLEELRQKREIERLKHQVCLSVLLLSLCLFLCLFLCLSK